MEIREYPYQWLRKPKDAKRIRMSNLGWTAPMQFPFPVWLNGNLCKNFYINNFGAIRFPEILGDKYHFIQNDRKLFKDISDTDKGMLVVPWGEEQRVISCGVGVWMFTVGDKFVIDYVTKSPYDNRTSFVYQVVFSATEKDQIVLNYYHCVSGYSTFVGMVLKPEDYVDWPLKEHQPYMKKSLIVDLTPDFAVTPEPDFPPSKPFGPPDEPKGNDQDNPYISPAVDPEPAQWEEMYQWEDIANIYQLRRNQK